jgi:hypothetical protein
LLRLVGLFHVLRVASRSLIYLRSLLLFLTLVLYAMGSGSSRLETRWWEAEAQRKISTTKNTDRVVVICLLIPDMDATTIVDRLKERSDLDTLFELHYRY